MDYKNKYKAALSWMESVYPTLTGSAKEDAEHYFPELIESEDERIRNEIIDYLHLVGKGDGDYAQPMIDRWIAYLEKQKEQKPAVSREEILYQLLQNSSITMSDYLYLTNKQKPAEWSEEDEEMIKSILFVLESYVSKAECEQSPALTATYPTYYKEIDWLKSLRPSWKPSEEQMEALRKAVNKLAKTDVADSVRLSIIFDNLKKLM